MFVSVVVRTDCKSRALIGMNGLRSGSREVSGPLEKNA
jgi:hypothetical protein